MKGIDIIKETEQMIKEWGYDENRTAMLNQAAHIQLLELHARALACHCECLGMNAENCRAAMLNQPTPYSDDSYLSCMNKWGLINEKGDCLI